MSNRKKTPFIRKSGARMVQEKKPNRNPITLSTNLLTIIHMTESIGGLISAAFVCVRHAWEWISNRIDSKSMMITIIFFFHKYSCISISGTTTNTNRKKNAHKYSPSKPFIRPYIVIGNTKRNESTDIWGREKKKWCQNRCCENNRNMIQNVAFFSIICALHIVGWLFSVRFFGDSSCSMPVRMADEEGDGTSIMPMPRCKRTKRKNTFLCAKWNEWDE